MGEAGGQGLVEGGDDNYGLGRAGYLKDVMNVCQ